MNFTNFLADTIPRRLIDIIILFYFKDIYYE